MRPHAVCNEQITISYAIETAKKESYDGKYTVAYEPNTRAPMSAEDVLKLLLPQQINTVAVDDDTALRMLEFYPEWISGNEYPAGHKIRRNGKLYRCIQAHSSQSGWEPENVASLWEQINETHAGTLEDPIPYEGNMALTAGLYYHQNSTVYCCTRDTINPVYNALHELTGLYVEEIT